MITLIPSLGCDCLRYACADQTRSEPDRNMAHHVMKKKPWEMAYLKSVGATCLRQFVVSSARVTRRSKTALLEARSRHPCPCLSKPTLIMAEANGFAILNGTFEPHLIQQAANKIETGQVKIFRYLAKHCHLSTPSSVLAPACD